MLSDSCSTGQEGRDPPDDSVENFAHLFKRSFRLFWSIALGIVGERALAEDVVQEAAIVAMGKFDTYKRGTSFDAWMGKMVRYVALNLARKERRRRPVSYVENAGLAQLLPPSNPDLHPNSTPSDAHRKSMDEAVVEGLGQLGDVARACVILRIVEGLDYSRIAEIMGIPPGTAMSHVHRSRKFLRGLLGQSRHQHGSDSK